MLSVSGLIKSFGTSDGVVGAVRGVSLEVASGEFFTILGPSGSGKSTLLRCLAGLEMPDAGEIRIGSDVVFSSERHRFVPPEKRDLAMVFQSYAVWPHMTVHENVEYPLRVQRVPRAERRERVLRTLDLVGLTGLGKRNAAELSGGQQQRVSLARALTKGASVILLDEPLSNLDAKLRVQVRYELADLQRRLALTMVYVTHDQEEAFVLSDRIAVMNLGIVEQHAPAMEIYQRPSTRFVAEFIGQTNVIDGTLLRKERTGVVVDTGIGEVLVDAAGSPAEAGEGRAASVSIRPHEIVLLPRREQLGPNEFSARVARVFFNGRYVEYRMAIGNVNIMVQTWTHLSLAEGDVVALAFPPEHCVLLPT